jgi:hypothetical protein
MGNYNYSRSAFNYVTQLHANVNNIFHGNCEAMTYFITRIETIQTKF